MAVRYLALCLVLVGCGGSSQNPYSGHWRGVWCHQKVTDIQGPIDALVGHDGTLVLRVDSLGYDGTVSGDGEVSGPIPGKFRLSGGVIWFELTYEDQPIAGYMDLDHE